MSDTAIRLDTRLARGQLMHKDWQPFFRWANGVTDDPKKPNYLSPLYIAKAIWPLYLPLQLAGLVSERANKIAKGFYGTLWSWIYTILRPLKNDRDQLTDEGTSEPITPFIKKAFNINEHFRLIGGLIVTGFYGFGAHKTLWGALTGNDDTYEKGVELYFKGMNDQISEFGSMNLERVLKRIYNPSQLQEAGRHTDDAKARIELIDAISFPVTTATRILETLKMFGMNLGEGVQRFIDGVGYAFYGTWAAKFGILKSMEEKGGDLEPLNAKFKGTKLERVDQFLHDTQQYGGRSFHILLPALSWISAGAKFLGFDELAKNVFTIEGYAEKLNPKIAAWCFRNTWFEWIANWFGICATQPIQQTQVAEQPAVQEQARAKAVKEQVVAHEAQEEAPVRVGSNGKVPHVEEIEPGTSRLKEILKRDPDLIDWGMIFEEASEGRITWDEIATASEEGYIPLDAIQSNMSSFPDNHEEQIYLDRALEGAYLASLLPYHSDSFSLNRKVEQETFGKSY